MKKSLLTIFLTSLLMLFAFSIPALAADVNNDTANATANATKDQTNTKYFNVQYGDADKKSLLMMVYQAQDGDTLASIAQKYNISPEVLKFLNQLKDENITSGQQLIVAIPQQQTLNVELTPINQATVNQTPVIQAPVKKTPVKNVPVTKAKDLAIPSDSSPRTIDQSISKYTQHDLDVLAHVVYGEARGETFNGKVAVAAVVLNRTQSSVFSKTVSGVVFDPFAFTAVSDGQYNLNPDNSAYEAAKQAMRGVDPTNGALYYWNPITATSKWIWSRPITSKIGNHVFAK